ncbi:acetyltransferase-like isoleucine patch superfamily enzyme [Arthrobacter sp. JUb115]|nr:acetyltransferase-like isoleucine patch superfamily enzyme [Arthrobacter sp. JUb115]
MSTSLLVRSCSAHDFVPGNEKYYTRIQAGNTNSRSAISGIVTGCSLFMAVGLLLAAELPHEMNPRAVITPSPAVPEGNALLQVQGPTTLGIEGGSRYSSSHREELMMGEFLGIDDLLEALNAGQRITAGSPLHALMHSTSQDALRICAELNDGYRSPGQVRDLLRQLTGTNVDDSVVLFPPFNSEFGRNIELGKNVFINAGCKFQDQGGISIGDECLIGHNVVVATLNHDLEPARRADMIPAPVIIGRNVWIGANATILSGVTIGENAVVAAAAVVTKDVPAGAVVVGSPARVVRTV